VDRKTTVESYTSTALATGLYRAFSKMSSYTMVDISCLMVISKDIIETGPKRVCLLLVNSPNPIKFIMWNFWGDFDFNPAIGLGFSETDGVIRMAIPRFLAKYVYH